MKDFDVQVLGAGIVGRSLALALARAGLSVALRSTLERDSQVSPMPDVRAYALSAASVQLLRSLKVWDSLPTHTATPVLDMRVQGDAGRSALDFSAWRQRVDALAWITDAAVLERELAAAVRFAPHITVVDANADTRDVRATLTALCEGKSSQTRQDLGIAFDRQDYGDRAIATRLTSTRAHQGVARQWFRSPDVLALLPFDDPEPDHSFALVWSLPDARAQELLALSPREFEQALMRASGGEAGELTLACERASWPLMLGNAPSWCGQGWVLVGDAAHVVHPLAGQGLNLGLADVAALVRVICEREPWRALGDVKLLRRYERDRAAPTWAMERVTDGLHWIFSQDAPTLRELRNRGLTLVNHLSPLKRWLTARALHS
jgi:ubiquinone biosynthesis UbiH/UbiF/VisC/COQ6 family hydroxylase